MCFYTGIFSAGVLQVSEGFRCFSSDVRLKIKACRKQESLDFLSGCVSASLPSVQGGVESGVDATEPYSSGGEQSTFKVNQLVNKAEEKDMMLFLLLQAAKTMSSIILHRPLYSIFTAAPKGKSLIA